MNYLAKILIINIFILFFFACKGNQSKLEYAFESAGENRKELEKVLEHYKDDSLKLKAAIFLIENMPYYFSYEGKDVEILKQFKEREIKKPYGTRSYPTNILNTGNLKKNYDTKVITADYLIENIDLSFTAWQQRPWSKYISFDDFCELVLPYRIKNEPLESWRKVYYERYTPVLDSIYQGTDILEATNKMREYLNKEGFEFDTPFHTMCLGSLFLLNNRIGSCVEYSDLTTYVMRALGFPVTSDFQFIPPNNKGGHTWNVLRDTTQKDIPFWYSGTKAERTPINRKLGKVYRNCFKIAEEKIPGMHQDADIPRTIRNPFIKDVTERYFGTNETTINISRNKEKYVYLGMFSQSKWVPVDITVPQNGKATFKNLDIFVIYQPLFYKGEEAAPAGYPFMSDGKKTYCLIPDSTHKIKMELKRKFMMREEIVYYLQCMDGVKIEASNDKNFKSATLLYEVKGAMQDNYNILCPESNNKFRYVKYSAPIQIPAYLAELSFYHDSLAKDKIIASIYDGNYCLLDTQKEIRKISDYNPLTYYTLNDKQKQLIFDFGKAESINSIFLVPRNDDNFIWPGDAYELFYNDGPKGWVSMGKQTATGNRLYYDNVPSKALYVLRNLTKGREELVFCYANGVQYFPPGDNKADWLKEYDKKNEAK